MPAVGFHLPNTRQAAKRGTVASVRAGSSKQMVYNGHMKRFWLCALFCLPFVFTPLTANAARCVGGACSACTSCSACKHCAKGGGTCSVCTGGGKAAPKATRNTPRDTTRPAPRSSPRSAPAPSRYVAPDLRTSAQKMADMEKALAASVAASTGAATAPPRAATTNKCSASATVYFSSKGCAQDAIIKEIDAA